MLPQSHLSLACKGRTTSHSLITYTTHSHLYVHVHVYVCVCTIFYVNYIATYHKMEDDSLLDDPTILVRETPPQTSVTPGSFSMKLVSRLGLNRIKRSETV